MNKAKKIKPIYLYLIGSLVGTMGLIFVKPLNENAAAVIQLAGLAIIIAAIIKYLKS